MENTDQSAQALPNPGPRHRSLPISNITANEITFDSDTTELQHVDLEENGPAGGVVQAIPEIDNRNAVRSQRLQRQPRWYHIIENFWKHYIQLAVPHVDCRDHLANERTFLAYQRTSLALSIIGVVTAQLFNLQRLTSVHVPAGYFALSKPLGAIFQIAAVMVIVIGAHRFWRQQMNMARGKILVGGWEVYAIMATMLLLVLLVFALLIAIDIKEESSSVW
ncbi:hypothetical protein BDV97DRAFT_294434 [Delphinella strobiligena]|nr:hypothetical protein BDV97DRAFT_294434 [Delphinella strobiligena]